jgi:GNAT superfamily N-acetyltransferase
MRVLVALERADVRGFTLVHPSYDPDSDQVADGEVGEFVIDPDHQRAGHGSRLLQAAIDTLAADKFTRAVWWVDSTDDALRAFVTESGWEPDGAHRELAAETGDTLKQIRLHTAIG